MVRRKHRLVATDQMVPVSPITAELPAVGVEPIVGSNGSRNGHVPAPNPGDDYWARALGKSSVPPVAPPPAAVRRRSDNTAPRPHEAEQPAEDTAAGYWDRARGAAPRRPSLPQRSSAVPPAAAVSVAPEAAQDAQVTTEDAAVLSSALVASEPASVPTESLAIAGPATEVRGAHAGKEDSVAVEVRGAHVKADDLLVGAGMEAHLAEDNALAAQVRGAHVKADDPLAATFSPAHASKTTGRVEPSEVEAKKSEAESEPAKARRRRWGVVPVAGAATALAVGLGAGSAYGYFTSSGSGTGQASTGTLSGVTVAALSGGDSPTTKLVPGGTADVILRVNNTNAYAVTLVSVAGGPAAITVSGGSGCTLANSGVSFVNQSGLSVAIGASGTTLVDLPGAATMTTSSFTGCQNATFNIPVSITVQQ